MLVGLTLAAAAGPAGDRPVVSVVYRFDAPVTESVGDHTRLTVPGCGHLHRVGEPALPFRTARILLPPGATATNVTVGPAAEPATLPGHWRIEYAGQPHARPATMRTPFGPGLNRLIYNADTPYPPAPAELISVQRLAGRDIALVRVFPVRYKPASGQLLFTPELTLNVSLAPAPAESAPPVRPPTPEQAISRIASFVDNPEALERPPQGALAAGPAPAVKFDYLLLTAGNLASAFEPLAVRKARDGLAVKVVTLEAVTNTVSGRDVPERIRNYIRQAYTNWGVRYVLLGGGTSLIPCRYAYVAAGFEPRDSYLPTDLYYACLDGSWNGNNDGHWGEPTDGDGGGDVDLLAEVYVGRAPVTTVTQAATFVEKSIRYETESDADLTNALLLGTFLGDFPTGSCQGGDMFKPLLPLLSGFQTDRLDDQPLKLPQWARPEALAALNRSPHVVLYNGHGNADTLMRMHTPDLAGLTNRCPFLICSVGCSAAEFDHGKFWPDSFGEELIVGSRYGAFAAILNARAGWFDPQYPWQYSGEFQARLFEELLQRGCVNLGAASQGGKEALVGQVESRGAMTYRWCYYGITLLGDPQVAFRAPAPPERRVAQEGR